MQPVMHRSRFVHHMHGLSAKFSRYLSDSITPPSHAQDQEHQHGACAAKLPGICDVNLVSHTLGDIYLQAWALESTSNTIMHTQMDEELRLRQLESTSNTIMHTQMEEELRLV